MILVVDHIAKDDVPRSISRNGQSEVGRTLLIVAMNLTLPIGLHSASSSDDSVRHASVISTHNKGNHRGRHRRN